MVMPAEWPILRSFLIMIKKLAADAKVVEIYLHYPLTSLDFELAC